MNVLLFINEFLPLPRHTQERSLWFPSREVGENEPETHHLPSLIISQQEQTSLLRFLPRRKAVVFQSFLDLLVLDDL
jgi:hypothetical protein